MPATELQRWLQSYSAERADHKATELQSYRATALNTARFPGWPGKYQVLLGFLPGFITWFFLPGLLPGFFPGSKS